MNFPPRLAHLATGAVLAAKLTPTYAHAHQVDDDEASGRLVSALKGRFTEQLLSSTWRALLKNRGKRSEEELLEKVASSLKNRPLRPGRVSEITPAWSAFLILLDLEAGTASDAARRVMETPEGQRAGSLGLEEAGAFLASELTRKA